MRSVFAFLATFVISAIAQDQTRLCTAEDYELSKPGKCFSCPNSGSKHAVDLDSNQFYCRYTKSDYNGDGTYNGQSIFFCFYDDQGKYAGVRPSRHNVDCPRKTTPINGCTPDKKPDCMDIFERCDGENCKLQTDQCFTCPKFGDQAYVKVAINGTQLDCEYHSRVNTGQVSTCYYNATTGAGIRRQGKLACTQNAPKAEQCTPKKPNGPPPPRPYMSCPSPDQCASSKCWTCPKIGGTDSVQLVGFANYQKFVCHYANGNSRGPVCAFNPDNGKIIYTLNGVEESTSGCPSKAMKDSQCRPH